MKVQRKHNGVGSVQFEVVEETPKFYILHGVCLGEYVAVSKADYEPVQEWDDVTGAHSGTDATIALMSSHFKLTRHEVSTLSSKMKAYAYLLERKRA